VTPRLDLAPASSHPRLPDVRRLTVVRARVLGDTVLALPALTALRRAYPDAELTLVGGPVAGALLHGRPGPWDRVVVAPAWPGLDADPGQGDPASWLAAQSKPDLAVQLHGGGAASGRLVQALGARVTAGAQDTGAPATTGRCRTPGAGTRRCAASTSPSWSARRRSRPCRRWR
jgi:hypothetical protein